MSRQIVMPTNSNNNMIFNQNSEISTNYYSRNYMSYPKPRLINKNGREYVNIPGLINKNIEKSLDPKFLDNYFSYNNNLFNPNMRKKVTNSTIHLKNPYRNKTKNIKYERFLLKHKNIKPYEFTITEPPKRPNPYKNYKRRTQKNKQANNKTPRSVVLNLFPRKTNKRKTKKRKTNKRKTNNNNNISNV